VDKDAMEQHCLLIFSDNGYTDFLSGTVKREPLKCAVSRDSLLSSKTDVKVKVKLP
jgi:hypothetical protein